MTQDRLGGDINKDNTSVENFCDYESGCVFCLEIFVAF
jgi:hypothetical protein